MQYGPIHGCVIGTNATPGCRWSRLRGSGICFCNHKQSVRKKHKQRQIRREDLQPGGLGLRSLIDGGACCLSFLSSASVNHCLCTYARPLPHRLAVRLMGRVVRGRRPGSAGSGSGSGSSASASASATDELGPGLPALHPAAARRDPGRAAQQQQREQRQRRGRRAHRNRFTGQGKLQVAAAAFPPLLSAARSDPARWPPLPPTRLLDGPGRAGVTLLIQDIKTRQSALPATLGAVIAPNPPSLCDYSDRYGSGHGGPVDTNRYSRKKLKGFGAITARPTFFNVFDPRSLSVVN